MRGKYKRQEEGKGTKRKHQHQKNRKPHLQGGFKASRKPQLKHCKLKQDASTKQKKKKTRHEIDLREFSHEAAVWKVLRRKENESKLKWKKNKLKQNAISNQKEEPCPIRFLERCRSRSDNFLPCRKERFLLELRPIGLKTPRGETWQCRTPELFGGGSPQVDSRVSELFGGEPCSEAVEERALTRASLLALKRFLSC